MSATTLPWVVRIRFCQLALHTNDGAFAVQRKLSLAVAHVMVVSDHPCISIRISLESARQCKCGCCGCRRRRAYWKMPCEMGITLVPLDRKVYLTLIVGRRPVCDPSISDRRAVG